MSFWCLQIFQKLTKFFSRISGLGSKKQSNQKKGTLFRYLKDFIFTWYLDPTINSNANFCDLILPIKTILFFLFVHVLLEQLMYSFEKLVPISKKYLLLAKDHLILKCPFGVFKSSKKPTNFFPGFRP